MPWREVFLRMMGIRQEQDGLRRAAYIIHCSLVEKPANVNNLWPLPFDAEGGHSSTLQRLKERQEALKRQAATNGR